MDKRRVELFHKAEENPNFDLIVIGGGATGLWCALDATLRGLRTLLVERGDFASETSSRSTKLLHGGLRYLKDGHLKLVHEALYERGLFAKNASDFVVERSFIVPYYSLMDQLMYTIGLWLYDLLSGKRKLHSRRSLSKKEVMEMCPTLATENLRGGGQYSDLQFDDARFAIELAKKIWHAGGYALNYCSFQSFIKKGGKITGIRASDEETGKEYNFYAKAVINAAGVFVDEIRSSDEREVNKVLAHSRGSHIVLPAHFFPGEKALVIPKTKDNRIVFIIPWLGKVLVGTTDVKVDKVVENPQPTEEEIEFLLELAKGYLHPAPKRKDILAQFAGLRPLVKNSSVKKTAKLARTHKIFVSDSGLITIAGGKWTTARHMAEETIDRFFALHNLSPRKSLTHTLTFTKPPVAMNLPRLHPDFPYTREDIRRAVEEEMALHLNDVLSRRTRLLLLDEKKALEMAPKVAAFMTAYNHKDAAWIKREVAFFERDVA